MSGVSNPAVRKSALWPVVAFCPFFLRAKKRCYGKGQQMKLFNQAYTRVCSSSRSSSVGIVTIFDSQVTAQTISRDELPGTSGGNGWELCPVVNKLGIPLAMKKIAPCGCKICVGNQSSIAEPLSQVVRLCLMYVLKEEIHVLS